MSNQNKATVRAQRVLKHYKNNLLTQAGEAGMATVSRLLTDLIHHCDKQGEDFNSVLEHARLGYAADLPAPAVEKVERQPHPDFMLQKAA